MKNFKLIVFFILILLSNTNSAFAIEIKDDYSQAVLFNKPVKRIITLSPALTEIVFALHADQNIVATVDSSDFPIAAQHIKRIGNYADLDLERIISLKPDLILTWGKSFDRQLLLLRKLHIPIYQSNPLHLKDILKSIQDIGLMLGKQSEAEKIIYEWNQFMAQIEKNKKNNVQKIFYQIGENSFYTINHSSWINDAIELCGGKNIFADMLLQSAEVDLESIVARDPAIILISTEANAVQSKWQHWQVITAVKKGRIFKLNPDWIERPGPRLILGIKQICQYIQ